MICCRRSQDGWQQQREQSLMYARFYGALLLGILLTYQLQKCAAAALPSVLLLPDVHSVHRPVMWTCDR